MSRKTGGPVDLVHEASHNSGINKDLRALMRVAGQEGWTGKRTSKGGISMTSPDGEVNAYLPLSTKDQGRLAQEIERKVQRWYEDKVASEVEQEYGVTRDDVEVTDGPAQTAKCKTCDVEFASWEAYSAHVRTSHTTSELEQATAEGQDVIDSLAESASTSATMATSESVRPYQARMHRRGDIVTLYESEAVLEVTRGDETTYRCAHCKSYDSSNPTSVASHYSRAHVHTGEIGPVSKEKRIVGTIEAEQTRTSWSWVRNELASEIYTAMRSRSRRQNGREPMSTWCNALADKIIEAREAKGMSPQSTTEPTAVESVESDLVAKIRDLVAPDLMEQVQREAQARVEAEQKAKEAQVKVAEMKDNVRSLTALITEE